MARHSLGFMVALSSDIASCLLVTAIAVAPITGLICSGLSNNASSSRSTTGRGMSDVLVVVDLTLVWLLPEPQPAPRMQMPTTANAAVKWRIFLHPQSSETPSLPRASAGKTEELSQFETPLSDSK